jgi:NAD(P)-dependent dehydrogenase (short-subunit alcohol dehydrogenase family)
MSKDPSLPLRGRHAVVTGAATGIGRATAIALARAGADVAGFSLGPEEARRAALEQIEAAGVDGSMVQGDVTDPVAVESFAADLESRWGGIDIWVNNAAIGITRPLVETTDEEWRSVISTNVDAYFYGARSAAKRMIAKGYGRIVNISSVTRRQPIAELSAYVTSKGAVTAMTRVLALELAQWGITVNSIAPGAIETEPPSFTPSQRAAYELRIPVGRIGEPDDISAAVVFLASDAAGYVTGHELLADGGLSINGNVVPIELPGAPGEA